MRFTPLNCAIPSAGVYPTPGFVIVNVPVALAATPTRSPVADGLESGPWKKVFPSSYTAS